MRIRKALYAELPEMTEKECDLTPTNLTPTNLTVTISENTKADWSFGLGRAQFLEGKDYIGERVLSFEKTTLTKEWVHETGVLLERPMAASLEVHQLAGHPSPINNEDVAIYVVRSR